MHSMINLFLMKRLRKRMNVCPFHQHFWLVLSFCGGLYDLFLQQQSESFCIYSIICLFVYFNSEASMLIGESFWQVFLKKKIPKYSTFCPYLYSYSFRMHYLLNPNNLLVFGYIRSSSGALNPCFIIWLIFILVLCNVYMYKYHSFYILISTYCILL